MKTKIRFGILGCSSIAQKSMIPAIKNSTKGQLHMIGSRSEKKAQKFAEEFSVKLHGSYDDVLESKQIDAVYLSLPPSLHEKWAIKAARSGKHIICEKPVVLSIESARKVIRECKKNNVRIIENFAFKFHPQHTKCLEIIKNNKIGKVFSLHGRYGFNLNVSQKNFRLNKKLGGGVLNDVGCYLICISNLILKEKPTSVFCDLEFNDIIDVSGHIYMKYSNEKTSIGSFSYRNYFQSSYDVWGKSGIIEVKRAFNIRDNMPGIITLNRNDKIKKITISPSNQFQTLVETFCNELTDKSLHRSNFEEDIMDQAQIMDAVRRSSLKKMPVKI